MLSYMIKHEGVIVGQINVEKISNKQLLLTGFTTSFGSFNIELKGDSIPVLEILQGEKSNIQNSIKLKKFYADFESNHVIFNIDESSLLEIRLPEYILYLKLVHSVTIILDRNISVFRKIFNKLSLKFL
jgi:hypothetical protein